MTTSTDWSFTGHARFCAHPAAHPPGDHCAADPAEPLTMSGGPSAAYLRDHPEES